MSIWELGDDDVAVGKLDDARVMGMVDRDDDVAVACEVLDQARVELALHSESGREENDRPATAVASTVPRRGRVQLHRLQRSRLHPGARRRGNARPPAAGTDAGRLPAAGRVPELDHQRPRLLRLLGLAPSAIDQRD